MSVVRVAGRSSSRCEEADVAPAERLHPRRFARLRVPRGLEQLGHDLRDRSCRRTGSGRTPSTAADLLSERGDDRPAAGARGEQDRAVDVEEDQLRAVTAAPAAAPPPGVRGAAPPCCPAARTPPACRRRRRVEWTSVSRLAGEGDVGDPARSTRRGRRADRRAGSSRARPPRRSATCWRRVARERDPACREGRLHQPGAVHSPGRHPAPLVGRAREMLAAPIARAPWPRAAGTPRRGAAPRPPPVAARGRRGAERPRPRARPGREAEAARGPSPIRTTAPRLQPAASGRHRVGGRVIDFEEVAGVDPALVSVESERTRRHSPARSSTSAVSPRTSWLTCSARRLGSARTGAIGGAGDGGRRTQVRIGGRRLAFARALPAEGDAAEVADQADERPAVGAGIAFGGTLLAAAGAAGHGIVLADARPWRRSGGDVVPLDLVDQRGAGDARARSPPGCDCRCGA